MWVKAIIMLDQSGMVENWDPQKAGTPRTKLQKQNTPRNLKLKHKPQTKVEKCVHLSYALLFIQSLTMIIRGKTSDGIWKTVDFLDYSMWK